MWDKFAQKLTSYTPAERELIHTAFQIAEESHGNQKRASGDPYITHPLAVAKKLVDLKLDARTIAAGLLHDVLEDTEVTKKELTEKVGAEVTFLVEALTKLDRVRYQGIERKIESTRKMFLAVAEDIRVVLIKLADRLHNMQTIGALRPEKQRRIAQETLEIYAPLAYRLGIGELKGDLEDLSFPVVYPEEYAWIKEQIKSILPRRKKYLEHVAPLIERELKKAGISNFRIDYRTKHYYSLWKKLLRHDLDISRINDLAALRIVVDSVEECYQALGVVHSLWRPIPGRIKDYISLPKLNGYRSLHTTVYCEDEVPTEFQIRTYQMHEEAEFGIAAHWVYEETDKPKQGTKADVQKIAWVKKLQEWQKEFSDKNDEEFLEALKIDFFKDRIFVFTPKGEVIDLPEGATPIDFAYHIHSDIGNHMEGARVNGKLAPFSHKLASGDSVEILVNKNKKPSPDWLALARSSLARGHIRGTLRKYGIEVHIQQAPKTRLKNLTLSIAGKNRIGLLNDITTLLTKERLNITKTDIDANNPDKPHMVFEIQHPSTYDTRKLLTKIKKIKGVRQIESTL